MTAHYAPTQRQPSVEHPSGLPASAPAISREAEATQAQPDAAEFDRLQALGQAALDAERFEDALALYQQALDWAEKHGDQRRGDLAFCNVCAVTIQLRSPQLQEVGPLEMGAMTRLREILMRNEDQTNCRLAAYNLSRAYEYRKESRKGLFYARIALDRSELLARPEWIASSHNQIGNLLVMQSFFEEAAQEYGLALSLSAGDEPGRRAQIVINVAYCHLMRGQRQRAFEMLYRSLRTLRRLGIRRGQMFAHLDLCYSHMEAGRYADAVRNGIKGMLLAEKLGEADALKNSLYLLGQATHLLGDDSAALRYFSRLQEQFYPGSTGIPEFLMAIDVRKMINLRA